MTKQLKNLFVGLFLLVPFIATAGQKLGAERNYFIAAKGIEINRKAAGVNDFKVTLKGVSDVKALSETGTRALSPKDFVTKVWTAGGKDSFNRVNPNTIISLTSAEGHPDYHFMKISHPVVAGNDLKFDAVYIAKEGNGVDYPAEFAEPKSMSFASSNVGMMVDNVNTPW